jgi:hypothetical protein
MYAVFKGGVIDGNRTRFILLHKQMASPFGIDHHGGKNI